VKIRNRTAEIKGIFYNHCKDIIDRSPGFYVNESKKQADCGTISEEIIFIDGSVLNFFEKIIDGSIVIYSYEYIRPCIICMLESKKMPIRNCWTYFPKN
jgi:hypothetical protein